MMFATACDELEGGCQRAQSTSHRAFVFFLASSLWAVCCLVSCMQPAADSCCLAIWNAS